MTEKTDVVYGAATGSVLWNLLPANGGRLVVLEERSEQQQQVAFVCITEAGKELWRRTDLPEPWWINLVYVGNAHVWLRKFESTANPDAARWLVLNLETGVETTATPEPENTISALRPFVYLQGEPDFETVATFMKKIGAPIFLGAEYREHGGYLFISGYTGQPANYTNMLWCLRQDGTLCWQQQIGTNLKGIGTGTFFIAGSRLFFVKNKTELVTFRIV
ncbi:MAG: DUF4905 domain-containing protein [Cyclobacteriaceae bacterium]|nr:DUF4905 domain-containing protein [Cyclobacteriaceae bacterium]